MSTNGYGLSSSDIHALEGAISLARLTRYANAGGIANRQKSLAYYSWNARLSAALITPLHIAEIVLRNGVAHAIEAEYGGAWPWSNGFQSSLPNPTHGYSPKGDLQKVAGQFQTVGQVIAELKFVFWNDMLTSRHDKRIWLKHLRSAFQNLPASKSIKDCRKLMFAQVSLIRKLRNRIAHHEPIFERQIVADYARMRRIVAWRCSVTHVWLCDQSNHLIQSAIQSRP